jgi:hypothetical protein
MRRRSTVINTVRQPSTALGSSAAYQLCVCEAFDEDKNDGNEGVEEVARVWAALAGATGKEGIVVDRTTYG